VPFLIFRFRKRRYCTALLDSVCFITAVSLPTSTITASYFCISLLYRDIDIADQPRTKIMHKDGYS
jgi:hypothetical protein